MVFMVVFLGAAKVRFSSKLVAFESIFGPEAPGAPGEPAQGAAQANGMRALRRPDERRDPAKPGSPRPEQAAYR